MKKVYGQKFWQTFSERSDQNENSRAVQTGETSRHKSKPFKTETCLTVSGRRGTSSQNSLMLCFANVLPATIGREYPEQ